jgi:hypothetical protein
MTEEQKDRLSIYREFGDNAQKAYNFVFGTAQCIDDSHSVKDGVYIIYNDGGYEPFNGKNKKDNVSKIGLVLGEKKICIGLKDKGTYSLTNNRDDGTSGKYYDNSVAAVSDWDGEKNTEHIKSIGTDIPLDDGEFIPSAGQIGFVNLFLKSVNEALEYVGGEELEGYYWTSTEYDSTYAWYLYFGDGSLHGWSYKVGATIYVRTVSEFPL